MRSSYFILPAVLLMQIADAQNDPTVVAQGSIAAVSVKPSTPVLLNDPTPTPVSTLVGESIMDYKSVYDAPTLEEEVQMATVRFDLTKSQQDVWSEAAFDRRQSEKIAKEKLESKAPDLNRDAVYRGLRTAHNTFYETIIGYLTPYQKQGLEMDRSIMHEKQRRLAKLPPPTPVVPTVTVAPVDSTAIKAEAEKLKAEEKKQKSKKKKTNKA